MEDCHEETKEERPLDLGRSLIEAKEELEEEGRQREGLRTEGRVVLVEVGFRYLVEIPRRAVHVREVLQSGKERVPHARLRENP